MKYCKSILMLLILTGSVFGLTPPRMRPSPYFGNIFGMSYTSIDELGDHTYEGSANENNALIYTASAGYIDLGHLRESADRAYYLFELFQENLLKGEDKFEFTVIEPAEYKVTIKYPPGWKNTDPDERHRIIREISIDLGSYVAHLSTIWHEIISWYGYASTGFFSEKSSSFSWEDSYSDMLGIRIAAEVLRANSIDYNVAMTARIRGEIEKLGPQPARVAERATELIKGKWYSGRYPFLNMNKRNFDVGLDDGRISPFLVPDVCPDSSGIDCPVPSLSSPAAYDFQVELLLVPREREKSEILKIVRRRSSLIPDRHFPLIIEHIRKEAIKEAGPDVEKPTL